MKLKDDPKTTNDSQDYRNGDVMLLRVQLDRIYSFGFVDQFIFSKHFVFRQFSEELSRKEMFLQRNLEKMF